jgi:predicted Zn-dependent peptidase
MMLIASGAVDHAEMVERGRSLFARLERGAGRKPEPASFDPREIRDDDDLEQAHLAFAFQGVASADPEAMAARVFATALGGGMSSRLFQEAREKRGLCYAIYAFYAPYLDTGPIGIYAGTAEDKAGEIAPIVAGEMEALALGATEEETARARAQLKATLLMGLESPSARCERIASHLPVYGRVLSVEELMARLEKVDAAALRRFAAKVCERGDPAIAALGPAKRLESRHTFSRRFGRAPMLMEAR